MPLPKDEKVVETGAELLRVLHGLAGPHPGFRPAHTKGILLKGTFVPTPAAAALSRAPHFHQAPTPVIVRFSSSTGLPQLPDSDPNGNPRSIALRFVLAETRRRQHTDIVAHSTPFFPAATPEETLAFFQAVAAAATDPAGLGAYVAAHPAAQAFLAAPKPTPSAFAHEMFMVSTPSSLSTPWAKRRTCATASCPSPAPSISMPRPSGPEAQASCLTVCAPRFRRPIRFASV